MTIPEGHLRQQLDAALQLQRAGNLDAAEAAYAEILNAAPDTFEALHMSGVVAFQAGRLERAARFLVDALAIRANMPIAHIDYAIVLQALHRPGEAIASYDRALALAPDLADAHAACGSLLHGLNRLEEALASYDKAIALNAHGADLHYNRGLALRGLARLDEAVASFDRAIAVQPDLPDAHALRGAVLLDLRRTAESLASYDTAIALRPADTEALVGRGVVLQAMGRTAAALASYDQALAIAPDHVSAHNNRAGALKELGRDQDAIASLDRVIAIAPDHPDANWNRALFHLREGNFSDGWRLYEWRKRTARAPGTAPDFGKPIWRGDVGITGKSIVVTHEQGLGDAIQFCRYLPLLERLGARVTFFAHPRLKRLLRTLDMRGDIVDAIADPAPYDFQAPLMSLPLAFKTDLSSIPADVPYLQAKDERVLRWSRMIGAEGFKIGICWQSRGGVGGRSFSLSDLRGISEVPGIRLISLQKREAASDSPVGLELMDLGEDFDAGPDGFLDTAAAMMACDLVISTDTSVAHLAGALGVPTWLVLRHNPDWRWMKDRSDSPWYPTMRLFRQKTAGVWTPVFAEIRQALLEQLRDRQPT